MNGLAKLASDEEAWKSNVQSTSLIKIASDGTKMNKEVYRYLKKTYPEETIQWARMVNWKIRQNVPLENIKMGRRPGGARETDKVKGIAEAVKEGKPMEPVVLVKTPEGNYKIADGYHRTLGFRHAGKKSIKAWVANSPVSDGPWDREMHEKKLNVGKKADHGLAGLQKEASLLGALGIGAAVHLAPNLTMKAVKSTKRGHDALTGTFSAGVELGRSGRKLHPNLQNFLEYGIGPESLVDLRLGQALGKRMNNMDPERQERFLNKAKGMLDSRVLNNPRLAKEIDKTPILGSFKNYMEGRGENKVKDFLVRKSVPETQPTTWKNKLGNAAMLGGAAAVDSHLLLQPAFSAGRKALSKSKVGQKYLDKGFKQGNEGKSISRAKEIATDLAISPAVLDPYRIGKTLNRNLPSDVNKEIGEKVKFGELLAKATN